jgi:4-amino-4-deoxy-L-arabinose transferase-like glycosyltransferase
VSVDGTTASAPPVRGVWARRPAFWRSPAGQPRWARPALLALAGLAGLAYGWQMGSSIEIFYAASVRSMSMSWHDFAYAAFDPAGTISIDKLPGAFWVQALSVRIFGVHTWAVALPQVLEGAVTVLVLYRVVRRLAGPVAGIAAAALMAFAPATVALDRGNISDTLLVLLIVLAADSMVAALAGGRLSSVLVSGLWVGLAFQAKMIEAWLVLPALCLTSLIASERPVWSRLTRLLLMVGVVTVVSLSWMAFVTLTPAAHRPYVDGSQDNSVFTQVFDYNGFGRVGQPSPNAQLGQTLDLPFLLAPSPSPGWNRLLTGPYGRDAGWLLPASLLSGVAGLVACRRRPRSDLTRAGIILWGTWLVTLGVVFSVSATINAYYLAALSPAIAALLGIGGVLAWRSLHRAVTRCTVGAAVVLTSGYAAWLLPGSGTGLPGWLEPAVVVLGLAAVLALVAMLLRRRAALTVAAAVLAAAGGLLVPTVAATSVVSNRLGPFDTPFQPVAFTAFTKAFFGAPLTSVRALLPKIESVRRGAPDLMATQTSVLAAPDIFATGQEVLPVGGYTGNTPQPTVRALAAMVQAGDFHLFVAARRTDDPRVRWISRHCYHVPPSATSPAQSVIGIYVLYYCTPLS